jgi:hypothetical protein
VRNDPEIAVHLGEVLLPRATRPARKRCGGSAAKDPKNDALKSTLARLNQSL